MAGPVGLSSYGESTEGLKVGLSFAWFIRWELKDWAMSATWENVPDARAMDESAIVAHRSCSTSISIVTPIWLDAVMYPRLRDIPP